jgi:hypothetical protein
MTRIYTVTDKANGQATLVRANSLAAAIRFVAEQGYEARIAGQEDLVAAMQAGAQVQDASKAA